MIRVVACLLPNVFNQYSLLGRQDVDEWRSRQERDLEAEVRERKSRQEGK